MDKKLMAAKEALNFVSPGNVIGLGTGTTANEFIKLLSKSDLCKSVLGVATSINTENLATNLGIKIVDIDSVDKIDVTIDGADEIDPSGNLLKGGGGALTREKKVALSSRNYVIIVSDEKMVKKIPDHMGIPIEILPFGKKKTIESIENLKFICRLRENFITDNGNFIVDCIPSNEIELSVANREIKSLNGVVETGLFINFKKTIIISDGKEVKILKN
ncbi:MAG: ribose-5-phosphate isomerase RpiA [Thermoplasmata archaeon]